MKRKFLLVLLFNLIFSLLSAEDRPLKVTTSIFEPFVIESDNGSLTGFSIDLWTLISKEAALPPSNIKLVDNIDQLLSSVILKESDIAFSGISMTDKREEKLDFSHPLFKSGLQIMIPDDGRKNTAAILKKALSIVLSKELFYALLILFLLLLISAHIIWFLERKNNDFSNNYLRGIADSIWWSAVTITTVGYGDKKPKFYAGKIFAVVWMFAGIFIMTYFTASVTTSLTINELNEGIISIGDIFDKKVATIENSTSHQYLKDISIFPITFPNLEKAAIQLEKNNIDAIVYDSPALRYFISKHPKKFKIAGNIFHQEDYAFAMPQGSMLRDKVNIAILKIISSGQYNDLINKWFGKN